MLKEQASCRDKVIGRIHTVLEANIREQILGGRVSPAALRKLHGKSGRKRSVVRETGSRAETMTRNDCRGKSGEEEMADDGKNK